MHAHTLTPRHRHRRHHHPVLQATALEQNLLEQTTTFLASPNTAASILSHPTARAQDLPPPESRAKLCLDASRGGMAQAIKDCICDEANHPWSECAALTYKARARVVAAVVCVCECGEGHCAVHWRRAAALPRVRFRLFELPCGEKLKQLQYALPNAYTRTHQATDTEFTAAAAEFEAAGRAASTRGGRRRSVLEFEGPSGSAMEGAAQPHRSVLGMQARQEGGGCKSSGKVAEVKRHATGPPPVPAAATAAAAGGCGRAGLAAQALLACCPASRRPRPSRPRVRTSAGQG